MAQPNEFDIAKEIAEKLKGIDKSQQERIIRWVSESVGLQTPQSISVTTQKSDTGSSELLSKKESTVGGIIDIRSFANSKSPSSDAQIATVIAYYYKFVAPVSERKETINKELLVSSIRQIGSRQPREAAQTLVNTKNQGYLDSVGSGEYKINSVGENLVTMTLGESGNKTITKTKRTKKVKGDKAKSLPKR